MVGYIRLLPIQDRVIHVWFASLRSLEAFNRAFERMAKDEGREEAEAWAEDLVGRYGGHWLGEVESDG